MGTQLSSAKRSDAHLWSLAFGLSLLGNVVLVLIVGFMVLRFHVFIKPPLADAPPAPSPERIVTIFAEPAAVPEEAAAAEEAASAEEVAVMSARAVRTSEDQRADRPKRPLFIGERDTRAASERMPAADAPPLPSQAGIEPRNDSDFETTESDYQDGSLESDRPVAEQAAVSPQPAAMEEAAASSAAPGETVDDPGDAERMAAVPPPDNLMEGPNPVDVPVPANAPEEIVEDVPPERPKAGEEMVKNEPKVEQDPKPAAERPAADEPGFRGFQRKTAIRGSISRTGRSALDVADSPLGRYQVAVSRAVEREWQRNCVRHRDFITPGFLTVRFFVEGSGKVRSVQFVGEMETGEVQKGFTLNSIRDAEIPPMPSGLRREFDSEPLELIFNFYF